MNIVWMILGLVLILFAAHILTEGASDLARRLNVPDFVIGMTVVAIGTSAPELTVSLLSAFRGSSDIAVGNVLGSNFFNTWVIVGVTALITPLYLTGNNIRRDIPFGLLATVVMFVCCSDMILDGREINTVSRSEGLLMLFFFLIFLFYSLSSASSKEGKTYAVVPSRKLWLSLIFLAGGMVGLVWGGNLFLDHALVIARQLGISESVIAVTLMAGGTSLPELSASVVAAWKKKPQLALGNILGSNILNIFLVLGASATVRPLTINGIIPADLLVLVLSAFMLYLTAFTFRTKTIDRWEGSLFLLMYIAYIVWILNRA